jgi:hypothetical protein
VEEKNLFFKGRQAGGRYWFTENLPFSRRRFSIWWE